MTSHSPRESAERVQRYPAASSTAIERRSFRAPFAAEFTILPTSEDVISLFFQSHDPLHVLRDLVHVILKLPLQLGVQLILDV